MDIVISSAGLLRLLLLLESSISRSPHPKRKHITPTAALDSFTLVVSVAATAAADATVPLLSISAAG